jgi:hypothetical protein
VILKGMLEDQEVASPRILSSEMLEEENADES